MARATAMACSQMTREAEYWACRMSSVPCPASTRAFSAEAGSLAISRDASSYAAMQPCYRLALILGEPGKQEACPLRRDVGLCR